MTQIVTAKNRVFWTRSSHVVTPGCRHTEVPLESNPDMLNDFARKVQEFLVDTYRTSRTLVSRVTVHCTIWSSLNMSDAFGFCHV